MSSDDHSTLPPTNDAPHMGSSNVPSSSQLPTPEPVTPVHPMQEGLVNPQTGQPTQRPTPSPQYSQPIPMPTPRPTPAHQPIAHQAPSTAPAPLPQGTPPAPQTPVQQPRPQPQQPVQVPRPPQPQYDHSAYTQPTYTQNQPTYTSPFPAAPQRPAAPYQPISANPAPNPYWASPELPQVAEQPRQQAPQQPQPALRPTEPQQPQNRPSHMQPTPAMPAIGHQIPQTQSTIVKRKASNKKKIVIIVSLVAAALVAAALAYLYMTKIAGDNKPAAKLPPTTESQKKAVKPAPEKPKVTITALDTLATASFAAPATIPDAFKPYDYKTDGVTAYITEGKACELQYGILDADTLPGDDPLDIMKHQVVALRDDGAEISDPAKMGDLTLKENDTKQYTLTSYSFTIKLKNGKQARSYYSVAILKDGNRAYVLRTCNSANPVADTDMTAVEALARQITLKPAS